jgi:hypothetical protein
MRCPWVSWRARVFENRFVIDALAFMALAKIAVGTAPSFFAVKGEVKQQLRAQTDMHAGRAYCDDVLWDRPLAARQGKIANRSGGAKA